jgi:hypothetical protein
MVCGALSRRAGQLAALDDIAASERTCRLVQSFAISDETHAVTKDFTGVQRGESDSDEGAACRLHLH